MCAEEKDPVLQFGITCILDGVTYHEKASVGCFVGKGCFFFILYSILLTENGCLLRLCYLKISNIMLRPILGLSVFLYLCKDQKLVQNNN